ncbi:MAG: hypothetical protein HKO92_00445 [Flavobacteriaceae bacterium]|nr:hypothetical protein [Flavobacteriaceae bacterium]
MVVQSQKKETASTKDSIKKKELLRYIGNGYFPTKYFDFDLRYLIKYNQYEGFRTGLGGVTNSKFSESIRIEGYTVYGFLDGKFKYSFGGGVRIAPKTNTWINASYTKDLQETGSSTFLTDKRFFQFFEPRLLNIELFHKHTTKTFWIEHQISPKLLTETELSSSKIEPTYNYTFNPNSSSSLTNFNLSLAKISMQWSPFSTYTKYSNSYIETNEGFPKFAFQFTKSFKDVFQSDLSFSKLDVRVNQNFTHKNSSSTELVAKGGITQGDLPITHSYHSYPNNVNKETIMQRFSVAGNNSFETMYFNEFYSDRFIVFQAKHRLKPFKITPWFKPQFVLISRSTFGTMKNPEKHENLNFSTLDKGYFESGFEINKLMLGFGLSFAYRHGSYHLPRFEDNFAFKFTFNINLEK